MPRKPKADTAHSTIDTSASYRARLLLEIVNLDFLSQHLDTKKKSAKLSSEQKNKIASDILDCASKIKHLTADYQASFIAASKQEIANDRGSKKTARLWFYRNESAMIFALKIAHHTTHLDPLLAQINQAYATETGIPPESLSKLAVLDAVFIDPTIRSLYLAFYNTKLNENNYAKQPDKHQDEQIAKQIDEINQYVASQTKQRLPELERLTSDKLNSLVEKYNEDLNRMIDRLSLPCNEDELQAIYARRLELALNSASVLLIQKILSDRSKFDPSAYAETEEGQIASLKKKFSKMEPQQLLLELDKLNALQEQAEFASSPYSTVQNYKVLNLTLRVLSEVLREKYATTEQTDPKSNPQSAASPGLSPPPTPEIPNPKIRPQ